MAVRRLAITLVGANKVGADTAANVTKSSPGGSLTGSNIVELNFEDSGTSKADIYKAICGILEGFVLTDTWPPA